MTYSETMEFIFHNAASVAANGNALKVDYWKKLLVEISGVAANTARTVTFYGKSLSGTLRAISGVKMSDLSTGANTTGTGELWQFDISGLEYVIMDLTSITGGTVTITGKAVS